jgi:membrane-associated protein
MEWLKWLVDLFLHLDRHLAEIIGQYGPWTYALLAVVIFCETGLVATPFLPGDSLLFAAGALSIWLLFVLLAGAAILGDTVNYWIGHRIGPRAFSGNVRFLKKEYLDRTHEFYERYGGKTIVIARFVPIVRTFAPFVAGVGSMSYRRFIVYNVTGGLLWVAVCLSGGYLFGNIPFVKRNFSLVILAIIFVSILPGLIEYLRHRARGRAQRAAAGANESHSVPVE